MDVQAYLNRIRYSGPLDPGLPALRSLHQAHLLAVPFENLDISLGRPIVLDSERLYEKIVINRRGGFCYELNGLFAALLQALGYKVDLLAARVANDEGGFGIPFDHMTLLVHLEERWLADVGFGESFRLPLLLDADGIQEQPSGKYRILNGTDQRVYQREMGGDWQPQYSFDLQPYCLRDFQGGCDYHQSSPASSFTQRRVCSLATQEGRVTLSDRRLLTTANGSQEEWEVQGEAEYNLLLKDLFGVVL